MTKKNGNVDVKELKRVCVLLNKETDLLAKINVMETIKTVGKGSDANTVGKNYYDVMSALDEADLIEETPEDAVDFWEHNFEWLRTFKTKAPVIEKKESVKVVKEKKTTKPKAVKKTETKTKTDKAPSNKFLVYNQWKDKGSTPEELFKFVEERVKLSTIKNWISYWKRGKYFPAGVTE